MNDRTLINALLNRLGGSVTFTPAEIDQARADSVLQFDGLTVSLTEQRPAAPALAMVDATAVGDDYQTQVIGGAG